MENQRTPRRLVVFITLIELFVIMVAPLFAAVVVCSGFAMIFAFIFYGGAPAAVLALRLHPALNKQTLGTRDKMDIARSWLLLSTLPWMCYVLYSIHTYPDAQNGIAFVFGGFYASCALVLILVLPEVSCLLYDVLIKPPDD